MILIIPQQAIKMKQLIHQMTSNLKTTQLIIKTQQVITLLKMEMDQMILQIILQKIQILRKILQIVQANKTKLMSKIRLVKITINQIALRIIQATRLKIRQTI